LGDDAMNSPSEQRIGQELWRSREFVLYRERDPARGPVLRLETLSDRPEPALLSRLRHAHGLADTLDSAWAARPLAFVESGGRASLLLEDPGGMPLSDILTRRGKSQDAQEIAGRLRVALSLATALAGMHGKGLIHKNVNPDTLLVDRDAGRAWLTGFTLASPVPRERREVASTEATIGSLPHASPEQTGRMNRSVDTRGDLYSLGVVLFELFTGQLPFSAKDPMEWVHCHIARTPPVPAEVNPAVPEVVSMMILKLLSKMAEDRYQTASGLALDLAHCLESWEAEGTIPPFALGENDNPGRLMVPETLYGRERALATLSAALDRARRMGAVEVALVSGYSGVGKSALINQMHALALERGCLFGGGKFDQHKRDIPYATFAQAFGALVRQVLAEGDREAGLRREAIREAVGQNGRLLTDLIPLLETLIGPQPPVPELPVNEAQVRFQSVFRRFVQVFSREDRPLVLALDDLQWIDAGSLRILEHLATHPGMGHLLIIGGYRANEVSPSHPLMLALETIRKGGGVVERLDLSPLGADDVDRMVADSLRATVERVAPLAALVREKTGGNPFFVIQFLGTLVDEGLLTVDGESGKWIWETDRIRAKGITDNVVDLMAGRLGRLSAPVRAELRRIACLGNAVDLATLALVLDRPEEEVLASVAEALRADLIYHDAGKLVFLHDRVREAAYLSFGEDERIETHLRIGRILVDNLSPDTLESEIFDVIHQLNQAIPLITDVAERDRLSRLNLIAGGRAKASTAHASALTYFRQAKALLPEDAWERAPERTFDLLLELAESEYLAGNHGAAETLFAELVERADSQEQAARVWRLRFRMFMVAGKFGEAVAVAIEALAQFGLVCPETPEDMEAAVAEERDVLRATLDRVGMEGLADLPDCDDPHARTLLGVIADAIPTVYHVKPPLYPYLGLIGINLSLRHGVTEDSCSAFSGYSVSLVGRFEDIPMGVAFSDLALRLEERFGAGPLHGTVLFRHGYFVTPWRRPVAECLPVLDDCFRACLETGNLIYAAYVGYASGWLVFEEGRSLEDYAARMRQFSSFVENSRIPWAVAMRRLQDLFIAALSDVDLENVEGKLGADSEVATVEALVGTAHGYGIAFYHVIKQITPFLLGRFAVSLERAEKAAAMRIKISSSLIESSHHFFSAMAMACLHDEATAEQRAERAPRFVEHRRKLALWASNCVATFGARHLLLEAEAARMDGRAVEAQVLYERAVATARDHGQLYVEGIANERAGLFARSMGLETAARAHLADARYAFERWGAVAKVRQLDRVHPWLANLARERRGGVGEGFETGNLDLAAVIKAQQAVSGQILLPRLVEALLRIVVEHAGADRGLLLMRQGDTYQMAAEALAGDDGITVSSTPQALTETRLAMPVFHYVARTRERVLLDNAAEANALGTEAYASRSGAKSVFCLPVITRGEMTTILYLENHLAAGAFTEKRLAVLDMLVSQASISLENATLYAEMEERVRERTKDLVQSLDMVRAKGEQVGILLDNSDQGFLSFGRDLIVGVEYSLACEAMLGTMPAGQSIDRLLWPHSPASAELLRDVVPAVLDGIDPVRADMMVGLLPKEIVMGERVLEAQYKVLENQQMMLVLTDVTAERRLRERVAEERRNLEMIVAAVTDGHDFFDTVSAVRTFARTGMEAVLASDAPPMEVLRTLYREVHTLKGLLNQFSFTASPKALHALEDRLTVLRDGAEAPTLEAIAAVMRAVPYETLVDADLGVIRQVLGEEFLANGKRIMLTNEQVRRLKRLASDLLAGRVVDVAAGEIRGLLLEVGALGKVSVMQTMRGFAPLVQRLAERSEKEAEPLEVTGCDVLVDPERFSPFLRALGHVFRNAITHGIEPPDERLRHDKNEAGRVTCVISHQGEVLRIEIADDGGGIDPAALRRRAEFLFGAAKVREMSERDVLELLFMDGLSTQDVANDFSGRGVGMAAVRQAVRALGGDIVVESEPGRGTRFIFLVANPDSKEVGA
jgi:predicted ATPase/GAF domain-containing protein/signal transduction histidine kinase